MVAFGVLAATAAAFLPVAVLGQVTGSATGFATGVTGGGDATPATPSDITERVLTLPCLDYGELVLI
jgi:hypothetical protein